MATPASLPARSPSQPPQAQPAARRAVWQAWLPVGLALLVLLFDGAFLQTLRHHQFDQFQRWQPRAPVDVPVRMVDIDEASLARLGQWPWPRTRLAELLDQLRAAGASAVVFDMVFAEPDRSAPAAMADGWGLEGAERRALLALPDPDAVLARSLQQGRSVLGFALLGQAQDSAHSSSHATLPPQKSRFVTAGEPQARWLPHFASAVPPLPALAAAAQGVGALGFVPDGDGVVRRVPLLVQVGEATAPSLVTEALRVAQGVRNVELKSAGPGSGLAEVRIGRYTLPTTPQGEMWLHYSTPQAKHTATVLPAWQVLAGAVDAAQFAGAIVLVGSSAQGLMDLRFGPLGLLPGMAVHAQALEQVLSGHYLQRPAWARGLEALVMLLGGALVAWLALRQRALVSAAASLALLTLLWAGAWWAFAAQGLLLDASTPALGCLLSYLLASLWQHQSRERQQRWIQQAFARYVSPNRVAWLVAHPDAMALGGRRQSCSFVFTDLSGFTTLLEKRDPAQAVGLLNAYLDGLVAIAFAHEGTLDRIVGDAVAIMFSAPLQQPDHRQRALACALAMDAFACRYAQQQQALGIAFGQTRIGVHSGEVIVGNFGGSTVFDYRALGDPVNTAARLEGANKQLGTRICISGDIVTDNPGVAVRPVGQLLLPGKTQALQAFEPVTQHATELAVRAPLERYLAAYAALQGPGPQALALFAPLARDWPDDPLVRLHHGRLLAGQAGTLLRLD